MADAPNNMSTLTGMFKTVYGDKIHKLVPEAAKIQRRFSWKSKSKASSLGKLYEFPVELAQEQGFTYGGEVGDMISTSDAVAGVMKPAQVQGSELFLKAQLSFKALTASTSSVGAFESVTGYKVTGMKESTHRRLECEMLYGKSGMATVASLSSQVITIQDAEWAAGMWAGSENAYIDVFQSNGSTLRQGGLKIASVDTENKQLTVVGTTTGIVNGDLIFFKGANVAGTHYSMNGLKSILSANTTIFNIDASAFSLWKGNTAPAFGEMSFPKLQAAILKAVNKGLSGRVVVYLNPRAWAVLADNQAALRAIDAKYSPAKGENGFEALVFHSLNGTVEIESHPYVKEGDAFILPVDYVQRAGSSDVTFEIPNAPGEIFYHVPGKLGVELGCYTDQAIFLERPAHGVYISGITYAS